MRKRDIHVGTRVEITTMPWKGRTGVVRGKSRLLFLPVWEVWCDHPDAMGRQLVRVRPMDISPERPAVS